MLLQLLCIIVLIFYVIGYIPYVDLPCERFLGESIGWIIFLSTSGPVICKYIPWLCCPLPVSILRIDFQNSISIINNSRINNIREIYGSFVFTYKKFIDSPRKISGILFCFARPFAVAIIILNNTGKYMLEVH